MQGVILAAGRGKRLRPLTLERSKAMTPVVGVPMVGRVAELLMAQRIRDLIIVVSPEDREIRPFFELWAPPSIQLHFVEQPERLGMAHALSMAAPFLKGPFLLTACDNLAPVVAISELVQMVNTTGVDAVLSVTEVPWEAVSSTGIVELEGSRVLRIVEKPARDQAPSNLASLPLYCFGPAIIPHLKRVRPSVRGEYELQDAIQMLIDAGGHVAAVHTPWRVQLTDAGDLLALNLFYLDQTPHLHQQPAGTMEAGVTMLPPYWIGAGVEIGAGCRIGPRVFVEDGCRVGDGVELHDVVVLRGSEISAGRKVQKAIITPHGEFLQSAPARG
jgi:dTDP-glucose pyrophosphorylase